MEDVGAEREGEVVRRVERMGSRGDSIRELEVKKGAWR